MCAAEINVSFIEMGDNVAARFHSHLEVAENGNVLGLKQQTTSAVDSQDIIIDVDFSEEGRVFSVERHTTLGLDNSGNVVGAVRHSGLVEDNQGSIHGAQVTHTVNIPRHSLGKLVVAVVFMVMSSIPIAMAVIGIKAILDPKVTCHFRIELYLAVHGLYSVLVLFVSCLIVCGICACTDKAKQRCYGVMTYFYISLCIDGAYVVARRVCEGQIYNEALAFLIVMWIAPFVIISLVTAIIDQN